MPLRALVTLATLAAAAADVALVSVGADGSATEAALEAAVVASLAANSVVVTGASIVTTATSKGFAFQIMPPSGDTAAAVSGETAKCSFRSPLEIVLLNTTALTNVAVYEVCVVASGVVECPYSVHGLLHCSDSPTPAGPVAVNNSTSIDPAPTTPDGTSDPVQTGAIVGWTIATIGLVAILAILAIGSFGSSSAAAGVPTLVTGVQQAATPLFKGKA